MSEWYRFAGGGRALTGFIQATGKPDLIGLELLYEPEQDALSNVDVVFQPDGTIVHARRTAITVGSCSRAYGPHFGADGTIALHYRLDADNLSTTKQLTQVLPRARASELAMTTDGAFEWPGEVRGVNSFEVSESLLGFDFAGSQVLGNLRNGEIFEFEKSALVPPGDYLEAEVFADRFYVKRKVEQAGAATYNEWYLRQGTAAPRHLLGSSDQDIESLATDGVHVVWKQGRDPVGSGASSSWTWDLYASPASSENPRDTARLLMRDVPRKWSGLRAANGWVVGSPFPVSAAGEPLQSEVLVVRISDGRAYRLDLAENWNFGFNVFPGENELWAPATPTSGAGSVHTVLRVPYESMAIAQLASPEEP